MTTTSVSLAAIVILCRPFRAASFALINNRVSASSCLHGWRCSASTGMLATTSDPSVQTMVHWLHWNISDSETSWNSLALFSFTVRIFLNNLCYIGVPLPIDMRMSSIPLRSLLSCVSVASRYTLNTISTRATFLARACIFLETWTSQYSQNFLMEDSGYLVWTIAGPSITIPLTTGSSYRGSTIDVKHEIMSDFEHLRKLPCSEIETGKLWFSWAKRFSRSPALARQAI